ncbi:hypothetical protein SARC_14124 [Sphaeroforma arctica JP610]|uniref:Uncharacterized protein n=1 Tax=Sphaeroforma arctica JP610 TaxID=667725 RepID=A0A0L0F9B5_9EUKA|nr:hypothetical protein SARC_14124 [Sphaeroforma arctica JP610]KNC73317.1 hypothetical protein SARC_14124 [Sphaeroforma arctica JP610]|eukprot:XP_014147219.1 hypothetical protein SARC_14124 [Sphaeroforma arctica JP610]
MDADESMYDNGYTMATNRHIADVIDKEPKGSVRDGDHSTNAGTRMHLLYEASDSENVHDDDESLTEAAMDADRSNTDQGYDGETEPAASTDPLHTEPVKSLEDGGNGALKRLTGAYSGRANAALKIGSLSALDKLIGASKPSINYTSQPRHPNIGQINNAAPPAVVANARIRSFKPVILNAKAKRKLEFPSQDDILTSSGAAILQRVLTVPAGFDK